MARHVTRFAIDVAKLAEIRIVIPAKTNKIRLASKLTGSHTLAKQHAIVSIQLIIVACPTYPAKFMHDNLILP